jgi:probable HAF family extracellular repeat protein
MCIYATRYVVLLAFLAIAPPRAAQAQTTGQSREESRYILKDLGTFGGPNSNSNGNSVVLNNQGTVVGGADTADWNPDCGCPVFHAFSWNKGSLHDLGTLPKGNKFSFATAINSSGVIAGVSDNGVIDPVNGETFVATLWNKSGEIIKLSTFGGLWSLPYSINDRGQLVGGAENTIPDPDHLWGDLNDLPSPTLWRAALWQDGTVEDLGTLGGPASFALFIDEHGQVSGISYTSPTSADIHPFFWENGQMTDIGTLGGGWAQVGWMNNRGQVVGSSTTDSGYEHAYRWSRGKLIDLGTLGGAYSVAWAINNAGWIVGKSTLAGDLSLNGFIWRNGVMTDLGQLYGRYHCNAAFSINSKGQVVGQSGPECDVSEGGSAWLWENGGPMVDLNTLVPPASKMHLVEAKYINDRGEITGDGVLPNGNHHAFLLIPRTPGR